MRSRLLAIGLFSLLGQVVLLRELDVAFFGNELVYLLALGCWLLWTAVGALAGHRDYLPPASYLRWLLLGLALALPLSVVFLRGVRILLGGVPGTYLSLAAQLAGLAVSLLPVALMLGLAFQWTAKLYIGEGRGRTLARAYALESLGALGGGVLATLLLHWGVQNFTMTLLCSLTGLVAVWPWAAARRPGGERSGLARTGPAAPSGDLVRAPDADRRPGAAWPLRAVWFLAAAGVTGCLVGADTLDRSTTAWNHPDLIATRDTPYCRVTVTEAGDRLAVFLDDALAYDSEGTAAEEFVHLAALQHEDPGSVLLLGGGGEGLLGEILQHGPLRVDYLELDPVLLGLLAERLPRQLGQPLAAPAVHTFLGDPRRLLARGLPPGQEGGHARLYDLILVGMPEPSSARANRYYTEEFFRVCRRRLRPGGILALRLRAADNLWTGPLVMRTATITHALAAVFSRVLLLPGTTAIILATDAVLPGPQTLAARLQERTITARLVSPPYLAYLYGNDRFEGINALVARTSVEANTDRHPVCYRYSQLLWLSRFLPGRVLRIATLGIDALPPRWRGPATGLVALVLLVGVLGSLLLARRRQIWRRSLLVALAALAGMILETVVLLHYQVRSGVLFQDLGLLLTAFMAGLWLGAAILDRLSARRRAGALDAAGVAAGNIPSSRAAGARGPGRMGGAMLVGAIAVLALAVAGLASGYPAETSLSGAATDLLVSCVMLAACGFLVAAILARASLPGGRARRPEPQQEQQRMVSPLYGADLLGGAVGSLLAGLVLVPVLGLPATALMAGGASLLGLLLI